ncbi:BLOC-1-related complex subunit 6-like [Rhineura floridana]|uniref:BLOC-1-related complex subunit 6-like n=1 Tax=Rhineura floridana TaxID=261503 RepID=UPI002AC7E955|nr:BLOC-1-related complex subunit 6-like [Rhineura floridana]
MTEEAAAPVIAPGGPDAVSLMEEQPGTLELEGTTALGVFPADSTGAPVKALVELWNMEMARAIDTIAPARPLRCRAHTAPWYILELRVMKQERRRLECKWRRTPDGCSYALQIRLSASTGSGCLIPAIDPKALQELAALAVQVATQVDELLWSVHGALQALTALSVGCIQTYRDGVESLGEAVDTTIRSMYTLMARCEELDKEMQPVPALARRIRDMKSALESLEGLCK